MSSSATGSRSDRRLKRRRSRAVVLAEEPALGEALPRDLLPSARSASIASVLERPAGSWDASGDAGVASDGFGLLVLDGVLVRRVGVDGRFGAELLSSGDLLRPWQHDDQTGVLRFDMTWRVLTPLRLAALDRGWAARMAPFPEVAAALAGRALDRSRRLAMLMAIAQQPRLEQRVWLLFWEFADRLGKVHPDGIHIDLRLTHELISHLVAARRPSVSTALGKLGERGILRRNGRGWVLSGAAPQWTHGDSAGHLVTPL